MLENFINTFQMEDTLLCDSIVKLWQTSEQVPGLSYPTLTSDTAISKIDKTIKDSLDVSIDPSNMPHVIQNYIKHLQTACDAYIEKFPECNKYSPWGIIEDINIQYYPPGGGYHSWHCERASARIPTTYRHLVYMTYLNDVTDQGETEFLYQKIKIKPKKGLTVIWPADWTYTHRGVSSPTQEKYIVTGWFSYLIPQTAE